VRDDIEVSKVCLSSFVEEVTELFIRSLTTSKVKGDSWFIGGLTDKSGLAAKVFNALGQREAHTSRVFCLSSISAGKTRASFQDLVCLW